MMTRKAAVAAIACAVVWRAAWAQAPDEPDDQQPNCPSADDSVTCPPPPQAQPEPPPPPQEPTPEPLPPPPPEATTAPTPTIYEPPPQWYDNLGYSISAGGGVSDFSHAAMRRTTSIGGSWNARITIGTNAHLALEGSYIGSAQSINRIGLSHNATLYGNGVQGALRLNTSTSSPVQPFAFGGAAYRFYSVSTNANLSDVADSTNVFELPVGAGLAVYIDYLAIDVRGEYRFTWADRNMVPELSNTHGGLDRWNVTGNVGYEF